MYSIEDLCEHLKQKHKLVINANQVQSLRNIGYYHGYKGYRFIRKGNDRINLTSFSQLVALNNFDMQLKGLLYPNLMFIENALKSYVLEMTLANCQSEKLSDVYAKALTYYKELERGSTAYKKEFKRRMDLQMRITNALTRDYIAGKNIEIHFYNSDRDIPIWAAFESLTLGDFRTFFACASKDIRLSVSDKLRLPEKLNSDGFLLKEIIFCIKDLRNAIAHNGIVFDTRFATSSVGNRIKRLLEDELKINNIDFNYIISYLTLLVYLLKSIGETKKCKSFINEYTKISGMLNTLPTNTSMKILGSQNNKIISLLSTSFKTLDNNYSV